MKKFEVGEVFYNNNGDRATIRGFITGTKTVQRRCIMMFDDGTEINIPTPKIRVGSWKNPNQPSIYGVGFMGVGEYKSSHKGISTRAYDKWNAMLQRCYDKNFSSYMQYGGKGVSVCEEWHNFQNFAKWFYERDKGGRVLQLDKDIRYPESFTGKLYSPDYCCLVTSKLNSMVAHISTLDVHKGRKEGVENYTLSNEGVIVYSSYDQTLVDKMKYDLYLQKFLLVGRHMERCEIIEEAIVDYYKKVIWLIDTANSLRNELKDYIIDTYIKEKHYE